MSVDRPSLQPIRTNFKLDVLSDDHLDQLQEATLTILETTGVKLPYEKALKVFADHGAEVDFDNEIVKIPRELVLKALATVPRYFHVGSRDPAFDFDLQDGVTYFTTDGCGHETVDLKTGQVRPSTKADVGMMARIVDSLSSMGFYWPMVSAQDCGKTSPLHELDASWNNTVKHVQSVTIMGEALARYGVEMATVIAGNREELRKRPPLSLIVCTIAPLMLDKEGIEAALIFAEAGLPVTFLSMPSMGSTGPATVAGSLAMADAEIISATVLVQLLYPGAPISHSTMQAWVDPRSGGYIPYPVDARSRYAAVAMGHHWGMPSFGGAFGTESVNPGTWQSAAEVAMDPLLIGLAGAEWVTGIGLNRNFTLLHPWAIILDDEIYHRARYALMEMEVSPETLAVDVVQAVGPGGHYLGQKHTRKHLRDSVKLGVTHQVDSEGKYRDPLEVAREKATWILDNYRPEPLEKAQQDEFARILSAAEKEIG